MISASNVTPLVSEKPTVTDIVRNPAPQRVTYVRHLLWSPVELSKTYILVPLFLTAVLVAAMFRIREAGREGGGAADTSFMETLRASGEALPIFLDPALRTLIPLFAFFWASTVWKAHPFGKRDYSWSLPVDRPEHDLWRVAAGAVHLMCALLLVAFVGGAFTLLEGIPLFPTGSWPFWLNFFAFPIALYLVTSIPALSTSSPGSWMLGLVIIVPVTLTFVGYFNIPGLEYLARVFLFGNGPGNDGIALFPALTHGSSSGVAAWIRAFEDFHPGADLQVTLGPRFTVTGAVPELRSLSSHLTWLLACTLWMIPILCGLWLAARRRI